MATDLQIAPVSKVSQDAARPDRHDTHQPAQISNEEEHQLAIQAAREKFVDRISKASGMEQGRLVIERDEDTGRFVHKLIDPNNGEVVRQWPDETWLSFAKDHGAPQGLWVDTQA